MFMVGMRSKLCRRRAAALIGLCCHVPPAAAYAWSSGLRVQIVIVSQSFSDEPAGGQLATQAADLPSCLGTTAR